MHRIAALALVLAGAHLAHADDAAIPDHTVDKAIDGPIIVGALAGSVLPIAIPMRTHALWDTQILGDLDTGAYDNFSPRAAKISDAALGLTIAAPLVYLTGSTVDDADGDRLVLYGETLAIDLALVQLAKYAVQRPRPYLYNHSAAARAYARAAGDDAYLSFYSSHAAMGFGASVAGAYLLSASGKASGGSRALVWGGGLAAATFTAGLRVRAGKHFFSDVAIGAIVGTIVGYAVPALHSDNPYVPSAADVGLGAAGILVGALAANLVPLGHVHEGDVSTSTWHDRFTLAPMAVRGGSGLALVGRL